MKTTVKIRDTGITVPYVLGLIAEGYSYDRILTASPALTMGDIMASADLARQVVEQLEDEHDNIEIHHSIKFVFSQGKFVSLEKLRKKYPRAYQPWTVRDDNQLAEMFKKGARINDIAGQLQRQPGAIRVRLEKLGLKV